MTSHRPMTPASEAPRAAERPVASQADAKALAGHLCDIMDALLDTVEKETALVRAGDLVAATTLEKTKTELASLYLTDTSRIKNNLAFFKASVPDLLDAIRDRHATFQALLQINLTVLATAHAVSESIIRGVAGEVARKAAPQTYGAKGQTAHPARNAVTPLSLSRTL